MRRRAIFTPLGYLLAVSTIFWLLTGKNPDKTEKKSVISANVTTVTPSPGPTTTAIVFQDHHYTCGARTQKGTPCKRRVKADDLRCAQHQGMKRIKN